MDREEHRSAKGRVCASREVGSYARHTLSKRTNIDVIMSAPLPRSIATELDKQRHTGIIARAAV